MVFYTVSDLHLSHANPKPMDIFDPAWQNHPEKIAANWDAVVGEDDVVLVPGDISWAMKLPQAMPDLEYLAERPGRKVLVRGNHDYWWGRDATNRIRRLLDPGTILLHGSSLVIDGVGIAGTRGWRLDDIELEGPAHGDTKIYERELAYLRRGLESLPDGLRARVAMLHYPPFGLDLAPNEFRAVLEEFRVDILVYGHVHKGTSAFLEGDVGGIRYVLASVDHTGFKPVRLDI